LFFAVSIQSLSAVAIAQPSAGEEIPTISLNVPEGAPLRLYLTGKVSKRLGAPVEAKVLEPLFSFDREVIPAGTVVRGEVTRLDGVGKWRRAMAMMNGDFTPLHRGLVTFTTLTLPDGRTMPSHTVEAAGLNSIYIEPSPNKKKKAKTAPPPGPQNQNGGIMGTAKQTAKDQIKGTINARSRGVFDIIRGPNKKEKLIDFLWAKLPYHPQYWRRGTRFDAPLQDRLEIGSASIPGADLVELGSQPAPDSIARVRLLTPLDSSTAKQGDPVQAVLNAPLFSPQHKLVLPEGTRVTGVVVVAKKARSFHRGGQLRFNFRNVDLPEEVASLRRATPLPRPAPAPQATLDAAEGSGTAEVKVDPEGGVQAKESRTRLLAPLAALLIARSAADNDAGHHHAEGTGGGDGNIGGRTLGGSLGFGMVGAAVSQSSKWVGTAFGYYGLAWSVYKNVVARGGEVQFDKNAMMDIKFGTRTPPQAKKFVGAVQAGGSPSNTH
jgi:hypothetical protein